MNRQLPIWGAIVVSVFILVPLLISALVMISALVQMLFLMSGFG